MGKEVCIALVVLVLGLFRGGSGRDFILSRIMVNDAIFEEDNFD